MNCKTYLFISLIILIVSLVTILIYGFYFLNGANLSKEITLVIPPREGVVEMARKLEEKEIIRESLFFVLYATFSGKFRSLQAGYYQLSPSMSVSEIANKIYQGETTQIRLTIPEGWRSDEIANYLDQTGLFDGQTFLSLVNSIKNDNFEILTERPAERNLEGYLFPDTYFLPYNSSEKTLIEMMLTNLQNRLPLADLQEIERQGKSLFEILTMAALIQREVRSEKDKRLVSGILWRRIEIGMPLQVDATIIFLTRKRTTRISIEETRIDSPYNTYLNLGLPPGPISNPGLKSIQAAIYPLASEYLFYLSKPTGETVFSRNFQEHIEAKNRYLR